jgi:hypothetical protein
MEYPITATQPQLLHTAETFIVSQMFSDEYAGLDPVKAATHYRDHCIEQYRAEGKNMDVLYGDDREAAITWMSHEDILSGRVVYLSDSFLSYSVTTYTYGGGAHGNTSVSNRVIDLNTACPLFLSDLFSTQAAEELSARLREQMAQDQGCNSVAELGDKGLFFAPDEVGLTDNFYLNDSGIVWQYNPYEIAPYYLGIISARLSWDVIYPYLLEDSPLIPLAEAYTPEGAETTEE